MLGGLKGLDATAEESAVAESALWEEIWTSGTIGAGRVDVE